jgi:uncharacterized protein YbjQ (UPF0145 family)
MISPKDVLVVTASSLQNINIQKYVKPVSAHVVAGTNVFSDLAASFTDFWGGRSESYQKQLISLYDEAIERIKISAFELGANCVVGLSIDMDEISGKNKAMFMVTAVGTAVIIDDQPKKEHTPHNEKLANVSLEKLVNYQKRNKIIKDSERENWNIDDETWEFITENQVEDVLSALLKRYVRLVEFSQIEDAKILYKRLISYFNNFPDDKKLEILYSNIINTDDNRVANMLIKIIHDLNLLDYIYVRKMLDNESFGINKRALQILKFDKPFYNGDDISTLKELKQIITNKFTEKGTRSTKKGLLSSKEKEIWVCECGKTNDVDLPEGDYCLGCGNDIWGVKKEEINPARAIAIIDGKIELISHFVK